jgi:lauroyl/myristoyl acyltransferase
MATIDPVRRLAYRPGLEILDRFLAKRGVSEPAEIERAHREYYLSRWANASRGRFLSLSPERQASWLILAPEVEPTLRKGALLVGTHFGCAFLTSHALSRLGIDILFIIRNQAPGPLPKCIRIVNMTTESPTQVLLEGLKTLRQGGVVFLAGDLAASNGQGQSEIEVNVLGHPRKVARGFVDLALAASIAPTPIFSRMDAAGMILTWVQPPLVTNASAGRDVRAAELAQAYADEMSSVFARYPGNVSRPTMERYLAGAA